jgi:ATP-dependent DNA ligase
MVDFVKLMDPKKLRSEKSEQLFEDPSWLCETKINGRRIQCLVNEQGVSFAGRYAREGNENINDFRLKFFKIREDIERMKLPISTLFDGEIHIPGRPLSQTLQVVNAPTVDDAVNLQEQFGFLVYVIFDVMYIANSSTMSFSLTSRKRKLASLVQNTCNVNVIPYVASADEKQKLWQSILQSNCEEKGMVFKFCDSEYECTRSKWWRKLKNVETFDAVIVGFKYDVKYPQDFVSSLRVSQYRGSQLTHVADVGGLTREQAADFRSKIEYYTGKVIQFKADAKTATSYKNPRFDCLRLDKQPQSCLWQG